MVDESLEELSQGMLRELKTRGLVPPDSSVDTGTSLVASGLIDSFGLVEVLEILERLSGRSIPPGRVSPQDLDSVSSMVDVAMRWGTRKPD